MTRNVERYHVLFDAWREVARGDRRLAVRAHVRVLYMPAERSAMTICKADVSDDSDYDWLPKDILQILPCTSREMAILRIADQVKAWNEQVRQSIPEGFLSAKSASVPARTDES